MKLQPRILLILVLLVALVAMGVQYDATAGKHWPYPNAKQLSENYDRYVGEEVFLFGTVERINDQKQTARIRVDHSGGAFLLSVRRVEVDVRSGGVVQVLGELQREHVIVAKNVAVVNPAKLSKVYKYAVSLVGVLLLVISFFQYWRVNRDTLCFEAR